MSALAGALVDDHESDRGHESAHDHESDRRPVRGPVSSSVVFPWDSCVEAVVEGETFCLRGYAE